MPGQHTSNGVYQSVASEAFEPRMTMTNSQQQYEAKANAERMLAVQMMINKDKYDAMEAAKSGDEKKEDKGGKGKKKK